MTLAVTNASRTNLMDLSTLNWHEPFLQLFKIPPGIMPRIVSNAEVYGHVAEGPLKGVPIAGKQQQSDGMSLSCSCLRYQQASCHALSAAQRCTDMWQKDY